METELIKEIEFYKKQGIKINKDVLIQYKNYYEDLLTPNAFNNYKIFFNLNAEYKINLAYINKLLSEFKEVLS